MCNNKRTDFVKHVFTMEMRMANRLHAEIWLQCAYEFSDRLMIWNFIDALCMKIADMDFDAQCIDKVNSETVGTKIQSLEREGKLE